MLVDIPDFTIIANPISGRRRSVQIAMMAYQKLLRYQPKGKLSFTESIGDAYRLAETALEEGYRFIVACGGDGTIHEVLNAICQSEKDSTLGILPSGKGNDLARELNIPSQPTRAIDILLSGQTKYIDVGEVCSLTTENSQSTKKYFSTIATCGFDAEVGRRVTEDKVFSHFWGSLAYVVTAVTTLPIFQPPTAMIKGDFGIYQGPILICSTGITTSYGGGMRILPNAVLDDGQFDVCIIKPVSNWTVLFMLAKLFWGGHKNHQAVKIFRTTNLSISTDPPMKIYADGEYVGNTPKQIQILPKRLKVIVP